MGFRLVAANGIFKATDKVLVVVCTVGLLSAQGG